MLDKLKTVIVAILAIGVYHFREDLPYLNSALSKTASHKNPELIAKFGDYFTEDNGATHLNLKHKPRKFYHEDYEEYLNVFVTDKLETDDSIKALLDAHDIYQEEQYLKEKSHYDEMAQIWGLYLEKGGVKDRRVYVSYAGPQKGYGVFAAVDILKGSFVGEYTGILTNNTVNTDYAWMVHQLIISNYSMKVKDILKMRMGKMFH